jgi:hypothetical protein
MQAGCGYLKAVKSQLEATRLCLAFCSSDRRRGLLTAGCSAGIFIFIAAPERC